MKPFNILLATVSALTLTACASGGADDVPPDTAPLSSAPLEPDAALVMLAGDPAHDWHRRFGDPVLDGLIAAAFDANRDLAVAAGNVTAARAALRLQQTEGRPAGEVGADASYGEASTFGTPAEGQSGDAGSVYSLSAGAAWELDFFGRVARLTEAASADADALDWARRDAEVLVAAELVSAYVDLRAAEVGIAVAGRNLALQAETLDITRARLDEGLGTRLDVARAETQARSTEAVIPGFEAQRAVALNRLATLTAQPVANVRALTSSGAGKLPLAAPELAIGDAASLLQRRADVRRAERELAAAAARVGVVRASYFPRITLLGSASVGASDAGGFGGPGSFGFGIGPSLTWAGFDRPRIDASVAIAQAELTAAFAGYEQRVLVALEETQSALSVLGREQVRLAALDLAFERAQEAASLARLRYEEGADGFIDVLDAETRLLVIEANRLDSERLALLSRVSVYRALGAGWRD